MASTIVKQYSAKIEGSGGDAGGTWTRTINFAPGRVHAQVSLYKRVGDGLHLTGIKGYRSRPDPDGPEHPVDFGRFWFWKSIVGPVDDMSSLTWGVAVGADGQAAFARLDMYWWS